MNESNETFLFSKKSKKRKKKKKKKLLKFHAMNYKN